jgi:hypothetical protein
MGTKPEGLNISCILTSCVSEKSPFKERGDKIFIIKVGKMEIAGRMLN